MNLDELFWFLSAISIACALLALGEGIRRLGCWYAGWRQRRRMRNLPPPDDPRLRNEFALRDWKDREKLAARLRRAA